MNDKARTVVTLTTSGADLLEAVDAAMRASHMPSARFQASMQDAKSPSCKDPWTLDSVPQRAALHIFPITP